MPRPEGESQAAPDQVVFAVVEEPRGHLHEPLSVRAVGHPQLPIDEFGRSADEADRQQRNRVVEHDAHQCHVGFGESGVPRAGAGELFPAQPREEAMGIETLGDVEIAIHDGRDYAVDPQGELRTGDEAVLDEFLHSLGGECFDLVNQREWNLESAAQHVQCFARGVAESADCTLHTCSLRRARFERHR